MLRREFLSKAVRLALVSGVAVELTGCGTVLHNERVGQPHSRDIDWKVAGLNGLGLILFFVPGVVAFAVDFYTGAIYLPEESYIPVGPEQNQMPQQISYSGRQQGHAITPQPSALVRHTVHSSANPKKSFRRFHLAVEERNIASVESLVSSKLHQSIQIDNQSRVSPLADLDQFASLYQKHLRDPEFGTPTLRYFEDLPTA